PWNPTTSRTRWRSRWHIAIFANTIAGFPESCGMFSRITGTLVERTQGSVVLDAGGLSYDIILPPCVEEKVAIENGEQLTLEVYSVMNMEGNTGHFTFYGFSNAIEREFFERLLSVASIGPRSAARAFSQPMSHIA